MSRLVTVRLSLDQAYALLDAADRLLSSDHPPDGPALNRASNLLSSAMTHTQRARSPR